MNKNSRALRRRFFQRKIPEYRKDPVLFAQEVLKFEPDEWQKVVLMDLAANPKVAIKPESAALIISLASPQRQYRHNTDRNRNGTQKGLHCSG